MKKIGIPAVFPLLRLRRAVIALVFAAALGILLPPKAFAQTCENPISAIQSMNAIQRAVVQDFQDYTNNATEFIDNLIVDNATTTLLQRLDEFDNNIRNWLTDWAQNRLVPPLKDMVYQLSVAQIDQTRAMGSLMDAALIVEVVKAEKTKEAEAQRRYAPSELSCQLDTMGPLQTKAYEMSKAITRGFANDALPRRGNTVGTISATGTAAEARVLFDEYVTNFCDNTKGDQGCTAPGLLPGKHKDIPALLWGEKRTIDMRLPTNRLIVEASLRNLLYPSTPDPIPAAAVESASGHQAILARRAESARTNAIYNVMGRMIGERVGIENLGAAGTTGTSGIDPAVLGAPGTPGTLRGHYTNLGADMSDQPSYRELQEILSKDRFQDPGYVVRMIEYPEQVAREQATINAFRLQALNDIYHRYEELLFMTAADYSRDLDRQIPVPAVQAVPLQ